MFKLLSFHAHLGQKLKHKAIFIRVTATLLVFALLFSLTYWLDLLNWSEIFKEAKKASPSLLFEILLLGSIQVILQAARLSPLLPEGASSKLIQIVRAFSIGQVGNLFFPARAGDMLKVALLKNSKSGSQTRFSEFFGSVFLADKLVDIFALFAVIAVFSPEIEIDSIIAQIPQQIYQVEFLVLLLIIFFAFLGMALFLRPKLQKVAAAIQGILIGARQVIAPRRLGIALPFAVSTWTLEAFILSQISHSFGYPVSFSQCVLALGILNLGIAIPVSIANIGTYEASLAFALSQFGIPWDTAIPIAATHHLNQIASVFVVAFLSSIYNKTRSKLGASLQENNFCLRAQDKEKAVQYFNLRSHRYSGSVSRGVLASLRMRELNAITELLELNHAKGKTFFDVGCGDGKYSLLANRYGLQVSAMDISPGMISQLSKQILHAWVSDLEHFSPDKTYDRVLCAGVLDFVLDPKLAFEKLCKSVTRDGLLVVLVPKKGAFGTLYRIEKALFGFRVNLFSETLLAAWAADYGLVHQKTHYPLPTNLAMQFKKTGA